MKIEFHQAFEVNDLTKTGINKNENKAGMKIKQVLIPESIFIFIYTIMASVNVSNIFIYFSCFSLTFKETDHKNNVNEICYYI